MKFFLDSADINEIATLYETGFVDGVTTNPSLIASTRSNMIDTIKEICDAVHGPVSAEVTATDHKTMLAEGQKLAAIAPNVVVKVPLTREGLLACRKLSDSGTQVNVTLCFSPGQAILAAKAGATFVSPFVGRLDDIGSDGMKLVDEIVSIYSNFSYKTEVLVASVRNTQHVVDSALLGADVVTLPPGVFKALYKHPLTDNGLNSFLKDWEKTGQSIL